MNKKFLKHINYYLALITIFVVGFVLSLISFPNVNLEITVILLTIVSYVGWGVLHHHLDHELTQKIFIEYLLIGLLGVSIVFFVFMGGLGI